MKPFSSPLADSLFVLDHVAGAPELAAYDRETTAEIAEYFAAFAEEQIAPVNNNGDQQGCRLVDGRVRMPDGFKEVYQAYCEQGWPALSVPERFGGQALDGIVQAVVSEIFSGANHSLQMVTGLTPGAVRTLLRFGNDDQQQRYIPQLATGEALATMCLTESGAGSDLSRIRCKAEQVHGQWQLTGEKLFISGGDQDLSERVCHLVLARTSDDGIKGLSLFLCPDQLDDGKRNTVSVTRIEEKMGLHASPTCELVFKQARCELIGKEGQGLAAMFTLMNHARIDVALQGVAHASRAHDIATAYAQERVQGRTSDGREATLNQHADVQRLLRDMDALAMGARAIAYLALTMLEQGDNADLVEFLTPVAKVYGSSAGIMATEMGMQVLGGYGYLNEYLLEQTYRDARITAIYEGANGIHARALVSRLLPGDSGAAFDAFISTETNNESDSMLAIAHLQWRQARDSVLQSDDPTPLAHDFMLLTQHVLLQALWQRMADAAGQHQEPTRISQLTAYTTRANPLLVKLYFDRIALLSQGV